MQTFSSSVIHKVQYYETDSMKIVHHSNYVRWMEEARQNFFKLAGFNWKKMEDETGIMIPVLFQSVEYKKMIRFDEDIKIVCDCDRFNGVKMDFIYKFYSAESDTVKAIGITKHGFIDEFYTPIALQKRYLEGYEQLKQFVEAMKYNT